MHRLQSCSGQPKAPCIYNWVTHSPYCHLDVMEFRENPSQPDTSQTPPSDQSVSEFRAKDR